MQKEKKIKIFKMEYAMASWWLYCFNYVLAMISYNIITGDTLSKIFQRIPGGESMYLFYVLFIVDVGHNNL